MLVFTVTNLKGGSTKTTTAAYLLHALHEAGLNVLGVDADGENESLLSWQTLGGLALSGDRYAGEQSTQAVTRHRQQQIRRRRDRHAAHEGTAGDRALVDANCDPCNLPACAHHHGIRQTACSARTTRRGK